jgi:uncharacterized membrane protein
VDRLQWLLALHVSGAFLFVGGAVAAASCAIAAQRSSRPSEIALFLGLIRIAVLALIPGSVFTLAIGLWLVHCAGYPYGQAWIVASIVLWLAAAGAGQAGGVRDRQTRLLAERLASEGDLPSAELQARLRDPVSLSLSWGSGAALLAILALMIWKPGA